MAFFLFWEEVDVVLVFSPTVAHSFFAYWPHDLYLVAFLFGILLFSDSGDLHGLALNFQCSMIDSFSDPYLSLDLHLPLMISWRAGAFPYGSARQTSTFSLIFWHDTPLTPPCTASHEETGQSVLSFRLSFLCEHFGLHKGCTSTLLLMALEGSLFCFFTALRASDR